MAKKPTAQAMGRATKAARDQGKVRGKMRQEAETRSNRLFMSEMAANKVEFTRNKVPTRAQDNLKKDLYMQSLRRKPANRPNAKSK
jgi:hypothetical protein